MSEELHVLPLCSTCDHPLTLHKIGPALACSGIFCECGRYDGRPPRPKLGQALAEAVKNRIESGRGWSLLDLGPERAAMLASLDVAEKRVDALEYALVAHTYEWAHDSDECPVCQGEVTL